MKRLKMGEKALNCLVCDNYLFNYAEGTDNQPKHGTEFRGGGNYGSTITDIPDKIFILNICDGCLEEGIARKVVRKIRR